MALIPTLVHAYLTQTTSETTLHLPTNDCVKSVLKRTGERSPMHRKGKVNNYTMTINVQCSSLFLGPFLYSNWDASTGIGLLHQTHRNGAKPRMTLPQWLCFYLQNYESGSYWRIRDCFNTSWAGSCWQCYEGRWELNIIISPSYIPEVYTGFFCKL